MIHRLLGAQLGDVMEALGDPPNLTNLIGTFWTEQQDKMRAALVPELHRLALHGTEALAPTKAEPLPILWDEAVISEEAMRWARQYGYDLIRDLNERTQRLVQEQVQHFAETPGGTLGQLRASLDSAFGIRRAQTIAVTETTRAFSQGMDLVHRQISGAGIRMDKVWQTSNDERVCPICGPNHGKKEREWTGVSGPPPAHPNCRCWVTLELASVPSAVERGMWYSPEAGYHDGLSASNLAALEKQAKEQGLTLDEARQRISENIANSGMLEQPIMIRTDASAAKQIAADGRFKSQFETHSSRGIFDTTHRAEAEQKLFGAPADLDPALRPIYGAIDPVQLGYKDGTLPYGNIRWILNDDVRARSTLVWGDSLDAADQSRAVGVAWDSFSTDPAAWRTPYMREQLLRGDPSRRWNVGYIETQIHGGVSLSDVNHVIWDRFTASGWMPGDAGSPGAQSLYDSLISAGIRVVTQ